MRHEQLTVEQEREAPTGPLTQRELEALVPPDLPVWARPAWGAALLAAIHEPQARQAFRDETGYVEPMKGDRAAERAVSLAFIRWFNDAIWGRWDAA